MEIKTIWELDIALFDSKVNEALGNGWDLDRREVIPNPDSLNCSVLYAELVKTDPVKRAAPVKRADPVERPDPWDAVRTIKDFCGSVDAHDCTAGKCPLTSWCNWQRWSRNPHLWSPPEKGPQP
jgi:hypothetical protein